MSYPRFAAALLAVVSWSALSASPTLVPLSGGASPAPQPATTQAAPLAITTEEVITNVLVTGTSAVSCSTILFVLLFYAHTPHLHTAANHLFMAVITVNFLQALNYFACIFFTDIAQQRSSTRCNACGFFEQLFSFAEPCMNTVFWLQVWIECNGFRERFRRRFAICVVTTVVVFGVASSVIGLLLDLYRPERQAWCWISSDALWFRIAFCWAWVGVALVVMSFALVHPLCTTNSTVRRYLLRRGVMALFWGTINLINILARSYQTEDWMFVQAIANPATGTCNVLAFLWSESYLSCASIGLGPREEPPEGFTAAVRHLYTLNQQRVATESSELRYLGGASGEAIPLYPNRPRQRIDTDSTRSSNSAQMLLETTYRVKGPD